MSASANPTTTRIDPATGPLSGHVLCPPDKSISHRCALFGAMSQGRTVIERYLVAQDTLSTLAAVESLGARVQRDGDRVVIDGVGLRGLTAPGGIVDVGNAGTLLRLLAGWIAGVPGLVVTLDGDASIRTRPMGRVIDPLRLMDAQIDATNDRFAPVTVTGGTLRGIEYTLPVASAQVKSCVLIAGMLAEGETTVVEPVASRDHTERMLAAAGAPLTRDGDRITIRTTDAIELGDTRVPGDPSSAAFPIAAALIVPGSTVHVDEVSTNWTRAGFVHIARRMGAQIEGPVEAPGTPHTTPEVTTTLSVTHGPLRGTTVEADEVPLAIDELPLVALLGCFAEPGEITTVTGAQELRVKETDRIAAVAEELGALGGKITPTDDGFIVEGTGGLIGGTLHSRGDHRMAMIGALAGLASAKGVDVVDMEAADVSYPTFLDDLAALRSR
ncbi:MAG: 3-phosphoshikimate 1-carboxyvinyltransferase [Solirubrobacteraceae bacterium]|nr:3-phosphoshikimate 1-carboxyvinyltransferase [Solirubrobacteraceae bacterium]